MSCFPMFMDLSDKKILLLGGGMVAKRKWKALIEFQATIHVVALEVAQEIKNESDDWDERAFELSDLDGVAIAVLATNDKDTNLRIAKLCKERHILINVADDSAKSDFLFSSYLKKEDLVIGISTGGTSPVVATYLKEKIAELLSDDFMKMIRWMKEIRIELKKQTISINEKKEIYTLCMQKFDQTKKIPSKQELNDMIQEISIQQKHKEENKVKKET